MKRYIIPDIQQIQDYAAIAKKYEAVFEYNDFYQPDVLDDYDRQRELIAAYKRINKEFMRNHREDTLHGAFLDVTIASGDKRIREVSMLRVRQSMEIAKEMDVRAVIFHTNYIANFTLKSYCESWIKGNIEFYKSILDEYPRQEIYMENMFDESPFLLGEIAEKINEERFGICFDVAHAAISNTPMKEWFASLHPYIKHIHINDNDLKEDSHKAVGTGKICWDEYADLMEEYRLTPSVLLEVKGISKIKASIDYLQSRDMYPFKA